MKQLKRTDIPIKNLPNGDSLHIQTFTIEGISPGPEVHIQANVHGAEIQGNVVIYELLNFFLNHDFKGKITFIPCANPMALHSKSGTFTQGRFNPITGDNWNRNYVDLLSLPKEETGLDLEYFVNKMQSSSEEKIKTEFKRELKRSYETYWKNFCTRQGPNENRALNIILQTLACHSDIVLDLHTGPKATRYLYAAEFEQESAKNFLTPFFLIIPSKFAGAMDEGSFMPWIHLKKAFQNQGRVISFDFESYTLELGSEEVLSSHEAKEDAARIIHYLNSKGLDIKNPPFLKRPEQKYCLLKNYKTYYSPFAGLIEYLKSPGDSFKKGDILAKVLNFRSVQKSEDLKTAWKEVPALDTGIVITHSPTGVIHEGNEIFQIMTHFEFC